MAENNKERRIFRSAIVKVDNAGEEESRAVEGYALLFDTDSTDLPFVETIQRGALDGVLEKSDVMAVLDHNLSRGLLARSNKGNGGTLQLTIDDKGLKYRFDAPKTALGDELLESLRRGDITSSSFCFTTEKDSWESQKDGSLRHTIEKINQLYDVSPVYQPAYADTSVYSRSANAADEYRKRQSEEKKKEKEAEISAYLDQLNKTLGI